MSKSQFLTLLSEKLSEELPRELVFSNLQYYEGYIQNEMAKGRTEEEIMDELGDPYMIARTIIDAQTGEAFEHQGYAEDVYTESTEGSSEQQKYEQKTDHTVGKGSHSCLIAAIVIILIVAAVIAVLGSVISFLWPVLAPVLFILLVVSIFKDKRG